MTRTPDHARLVERFDLIVNGPALFNALVAGMELGVFRALAEKPVGFEELHGTLGVPEHQLHVLLQSLCATELVTVREGRYANAAATEPMLCSEGPGNWLDILRGWQQIYYPAFAHATGALRAGRNTALDSYPGTGDTLYQRLSRQPAKEAVLHAAMAAFTEQSMSGLLDHADLAAGGTLLDVGGGDGTTARALVGRFPGLSVTVFDLPSVVGLADGSDRPDGRVSYLGGDLFADAFPQGVDTVLFSHCVEVLAPEQILFLLRKARAALAPGGRLLIYGYTPTEDELGVYSARLSLYLTVLATGQGRAYPAREYQRLLTEAGFTEVSVTAGLPFEHSLVAARCPAGA